ncbi:GNAT family N-acetyltransferase [Pseudonocardia sp. TRM90224]|uniref:GNAT family N-acetyltransferase n=1 Tax=Pseudonocardia sp. TRM90224 TaxID=2812678 RepID=UPI001E541FDD|nr:N-acetyltransferase [Pseudonocardia sp. TRM90224]
MSHEWTTRAETGADITAIHQINLAAFDTALEADLVDALRADPSWVPELSIISVDPAGTPVGYALLTRAHVGDTPVLALGPCAALPSSQRIGAGSAAIRAALAAATELGERYVVVLGHPTYYPRFGFVRAAEHGITISIDDVGDALMALSLDGSPLPSGRIRYAEPFGVE